MNVPYQFLNTNEYTPIEVFSSSTLGLSYRDLIKKYKCLVEYRIAKTEGIFLNRVLVPNEHYCDFIAEAYLKQQKVLKKYSTNKWLITELLIIITLVGLVIGVLFILDYLQIINFIELE